MVTKYCFTNFGDILFHFIFTKFGDSLKFSPNLVTIFSIFFSPSTLGLLPPIDLTKKYLCSPILIHASLSSIPASIYPLPLYLSRGYCVVATFLLCLRWKWPRLHFLQYLQPSAGRKAQKWWWSLFTGSALNSFQQIFPSVLTYFQCWCPIDQIWFCRGLYWMFWKGFVDLVSIIYSTMAHQIEKLKSLKSTITEAEMCLV